MDWRVEHAQTLAQLRADPTLWHNRRRFLADVRQWAADGATGLAPALGAVVTLVERAGPDDNIPHSLVIQAAVWPDETTAALLFLARDGMDAAGLPVLSAPHYHVPFGVGRGEVALQFARNPASRTEDGMTVLAAMVTRLRTQDQLYLACAAASAMICLGLPLADLKALAASVA